MKIVKKKKIINSFFFLVCFWNSIHNFVYFYNLLHFWFAIFFPSIYFFAFFFVRLLLFLSLFCFFMSFFVFFFLSLYLSIYLFSANLLISGKCLLFFFYDRFIPNIYLRFLVYHCCTTCFYLFQNSSFCSKLNLTI